MTGLLFWLLVCGNSIQPNLELRLLKKRNLSYVIHQHQLTIKEMNQKHQQELSRLYLEAELKSKYFTHEQIVQLTIRIMERTLQLNEQEINREQVAQWVREFEREMG